MHPSMLAKRQQAAQQRIMEAAATLAEKFNVAPPMEVTQRQPDMAQMLRWEGIADFLDAIAQPAEPETPKKQLAYVETAAPERKPKDGKDEPK